MLGEGVGGVGAGGGTYTADYRGTAASNMDFNSLRYKCCTWLLLLPGAEFQAAGKAKLGSFLQIQHGVGVHIGHQHYEVFSLDFFLCWLSTFH